MARPQLAAALLALCALPPASARAEDPAPDQLNAALGFPLFADESLWDDDPAAAGGRLGWPQESNSPTGASFRLYADESARVCGARPFSMALWGRDGKTTMVSAIFANKGDYLFDYLRKQATEIPPTQKEKERAFAKIESKVEREFRAAIKADEETLVAALTGILGPPRRENIGQSRDLRARASRWDWKGHAIVVTAPREEYVALKILPAETADATRPDRQTNQELKSAFASRVENRENGDVVVGGIPMVDQGPKGFCVPATWERYLRYVGIDADMYELAMAGRTGFGGGTFPQEMKESIDGLLARAGCRLKSAGRRPTPDAVAKFIDAGVPLMWEMMVVRELDKTLTFRAKQRAETPDPKTWAEVLKQPKKAARDLRPDREEAHMCMVIGYNAKTGEIAISDSWGPEFAERWITAEEASAIALGELTAITW